eukprot:COSAG02_NODE_46626_length_347_cov_0.866935_1_plen_57_part_10
MGASRAHEMQYGVIYFTTRKAEPRPVSLLVSALLPLLLGQPQPARARFPNAYMPPLP